MNSKYNLRKRKVLDEPTDNVKKIEMRYLELSLPNHDKLPGSLLLQIVHPTIDPTVPREFYVHLFNKVPPKIQGISEDQWIRVVDGISTGCVYKVSLPPNRILEVTAFNNVRRVTFVKEP